MPDELGGVLLVILAYFAGSFPTASIVGMISGHDPAKEGSGNPGASNVYRTSGATYGLITVVVDVLKGLVPVLATLALVGRPWAAVVWASATIGHVVPFGRWMRGGKGVATGGGGALPLFPLLSLALVAVFFVVVRITRRASVGSLAIAVLMPIGVTFVRVHDVELVASVVVSAIVLVRHRSNIVRLLRGSELELR